MKLKERKSLSDWLKTRIIINIRNEETFALKRSFKTTYAKLLVVLSVATVISIVLYTWALNSLLGRWINPEYDQVVLNRKIIKLNKSLDSVNNVVANQEKYFKHLNAIINGEDFENDKLTTNAKTSAVLASAEAIDEIKFISTEDSMLRAQFEVGNYKMETIIEERKTSLTDMLLVSPANGVISSEYNPKIKHYGLDIVSKTDEPIKAVADGTVVLASWTYDTGYTIVIQHKSNIVSVYKHNSAMFKSVGDFVRQGEVVALMGNTGKYTTGPHLHFELWFNGNPVNPKKFINL
ncbi:MAG: M23 family metallopeptidase [Cytophagales bacterium]